jgi:hypothetical protein
MATAAKFAQSIPIVLVHLVPLDVDVVSIKFHQFLKKIGIGRTSFAAVAIEITKGGILILFLFLSLNFMKHRRNIHRSV